MPDFTSALYLGMRHPSSRLRAWTALSTGTPAALRRIGGAARSGRRLAALQGCEASVLVPSTLHAAWDLGGALHPRRDALFLDAGVYPVLRCAAVRASARGTPVRVFPHHDADALAAALRRSRRRPVVLVDGVSPASGEPAPLRDYVEIAGAHDGLVVIDDTQALGILGAPGGQLRAWGAGGGGSLAFHRLGSRPDVLVIASAAKALGVPVAAVSGARRVVARYLSCADTWVHSSPVSAVAVAALDHALDENRDRGEELRARLAFAVDRLVAVLGELGLPAPAAPFPIVRLPQLPGAGAVQLQSRLLERGVRTAVVADGRASRVVFLVTARHGRREIDAVGPALAGSWPAGATAIRRVRERAA